ncbi:CDP-glycerol--glycerophosphate glycerophosphotransferase [Colwellia sp. 39_35_sub15_T18]|nr:CDP-glycerol--glycerophosphate glycerophosphotransferase [Colwellia sp. 39_35_sub15_T18]
MQVEVSMPAKRYLFYISQNYSYAILRPLQEEIWARGDEAAWFLEGKEVNGNFLNSNEQRLLSIDEVQNYKPVAIFYPANIAPTFLPGINVAVFHGFDAGKVDKRGNNDHFKVRNCFDLYCTQGPSTTEPFLELAEQHNHFQVAETGWCALDYLYLDHEKPSAGKPTILLCSTFSKKLSCAPHLFETVKRLSRSNKWHWLVQFHPKMPADIVKKYKSLQNENLSFVETDDVIPLLQQADVMVCDTSSVLIMFLLLGKPVVTFNNIAPTDYLLDINSVDLLEETIEKALLKPSELMKQIEHFISMTHPYNDGKSSSRVLNAVDAMLSDKFALSKKPIDFFRQFKMRKKLKYWRFG